MILNSAVHLGQNGWTYTTKTSRPKLRPRMYTQNVHEPMLVMYKSTSEYERSDQHATHSYEGINTLTRLYGGATKGNLFGHDESSHGSPIRCGLWFDDFSTVYNLVNLLDSLGFVSDLCPVFGIFACKFIHRISAGHASIRANMDKSTSMSCCKCSVMSDQNNCPSLKQRPGEATVHN